jgi:hypothetical protein
MTLNTSKTHILPNAEDWQSIQRFHNLPILPSTRKAFRQLMQKASLSFDGLAKIAEQDPAICWHMLQRIHQRNPASLEQISSASGCISLLGMEEVVRLVKQLPVLDAAPKKRSERNYMESLHSAVLAGRIAAIWSQFKPGLNQHQAQWAAMLASVPLWAWQLRQVSASQLSFNQISQGKDIIPAIEAGFGQLTKSRLLQWKKYSQQLALPKVCQSLWQQQCWPKSHEWQVLRKHSLTRIDGHRALKLQCQQPELLIYLANTLAYQYRFGAYRYKSRRWLHLSAHFLNQEPEKIHQQITELSLQLANQGRLTTHINSLLAPKNTSQPQITVYQCLKPVSKLEMEREGPKAVENIESKERTINHKLLKRLIQQLNETPESFGDWHYLMRSVLKGITEGIGLKHAYIMVQNKLGTAAKVYYQQGLAETDPLCHFNVSLDKASIFKKMLEKPSSLMITDQNRDKMLRGISQAQQNVLPQQFMMMSLFSNERPIGIIFADLGGLKHNPPMQPSEYMAFKSLCMAASNSLGKLAKATQKKNRTNSSKTVRRQA